MISTRTADEVFLRFSALRNFALSLRTQIAGYVVPVLLFLRLILLPMVLMGPLPALFELCRLRTLGSLVQDVVFNL